MVNRDLNWRNIVGISVTVIFFIFIFNILLSYSYFYLEIYPELGLMCLMLEGTEHNTIIFSEFLKSLEYYDGEKQKKQMDKLQIINLFLLLKYKQILLYDII